eukprot:GHVP01059280.1.p1 GENE.GHVP01059280.1~~GHVP01059280.1.p1  ORF type:complete len:800 (+),score=147.18 GHVP01059280.1:172-2571(+)
MKNIHYRHIRNSAVGVIFSKHCDPVYVETMKYFLVGVLESVHLICERTGDILKRYECGSSNILKIIYSPSKHEFSAALEDGSVCIWSLPNNTKKIIQAHLCQIHSLCYSNSEDLLATGAIDNTISIWNTSEDSPVIRLKGHKGSITDVVFIHNDETLLSTSKDSSLRVWNIETGECMQVLSEARSEILSLSLNLSQNWIVFSNKDKGLFHCKIKEDRSDNRPIEYIGQISRSKYINKLEIIGNSLFGLGKKSLLKMDYISSSSTFTDAVCHVMSSKICSICPFKSNSSTRIVFGFDNNMIEISDYKEDKLIPLTQFSLSGHRSPIKKVSYSPFTSTFISVSSDSLKIWMHSKKDEENTPVLIRTIWIENIQCAAFVDKDMILAGRKDGMLLVINSESGEVTHEIQGHTQRANAILFLHGENEIVTGGGDGLIKVWFIKGDQLEFARERSLGDEVLALGHSEYRDLICASLLDSTISVHHRDTLKRTLLLYGHKLPATTLATGHLQNLLVSGSMDKSIRIWSLDFGQCEKTVFAHQDVVTEIQFERTGKYVISSSKDGSVRIWDFPSLERVEKHVVSKAAVWTVSVSNDGMGFIVGTNDSSVVEYKMTEEEIFAEDLEDERIDEQLESEALRKKEKGVAIEYTEISLKDYERIIEALEKCEEEQMKMKAIGEMEDYVTNLYLDGLPTEPSKYFLRVLMRLSRHHLEETLGMIPYHFLRSILEYLVKVSDSQENLFLVSRVMKIFLKTFINPIEMDEKIQKQFEELRIVLQKGLKHLKKKTLVNMAGLQITFNDATNKELF